METVRTFVVACFYLLLSAMICSASELNETDIKQILCKDKTIEFRLPSGAIVDCFDEIYAIEVEWTEKWAEAIGQSLHYAESLNKKPAIYFVCRDFRKNCLRHKLRLEETIAAWKLPIEVFEYDMRDFLD